MSDIVFLRRVYLMAKIGRDCWHREKAQVALISVRLFTDIELAAETDDVTKSIDYGTIYKAIVEAMENSSYPTLDSFTEEVGRIALKVGGKRATATVMLPKALLQAEGGVSCQIEMEASETGTMVINGKTICVQNLRIPCIIGLNDHERKDKQLAAVYIWFYDAPAPDHTDYQSSLAPVMKHIEQSSYLTLEAMAVSLARILIRDMGYDKVTISAEKPNAYGLVECPGVEITREKADFP